MRFGELLRLCGQAGVRHVRLLLCGPGMNVCVCVCVYMCLRVFVPLPALHAHAGESKTWQSETLVLPAGLCLVPFDPVASQLMIHCGPPLLFCSHRHEQDLAVRGAVAAHRPLLA